MIQEAYVSFEDFSPIKGFEEYLISKDGRVYSPKSKKFLSIRDRRGYMAFTICVNNERKDFSLHRALALTFIPNPEDLPQINHKDGNKHNNDLSNLEWCSASYNIQHAYENKLMTGHIQKHSDETKLKISNSRKGKLHTEEEKELIRKKMLGREVTDETKKRMSDAMNAKGKDFWSHHFKNIPRYTRRIQDTETNVIYNSIKDAIIGTGVKPATINRWLKQEKRFKYVD